MSRPSRPFYDSGTVQLYVYDRNELMLRLNNFSGQQDTGFIDLPSTHHYDQGKEKFRFYIVLNYESDENEFGLWIYAYHPKFNYQIQGCTFRVIKGLNSVGLPLTTIASSIVGTYQSPCYDIVNDETVLEFIIRFPNMKFQTSDVNDVTVQNEENYVDMSNAVVSVAAKKIKIVNIGKELSTAFKQMMNGPDYDVYFVVGGKKIGSFKFALCAVSDVFRAAFKDHTKESESGEIEIHDFGHTIVQIFVNALHTHNIYFNEDPVETLQLGMLANKYNVTSIEKAVQDAFNVVDVNRHNFVDCYRLAAYDSGIMGKLMQRFVQMRVDINDVVGFEELSDKMKIELYQSAYQTSIGK